MKDETAGSISLMTSVRVSIFASLIFSRDRVCAEKGGDKINRVSLIKLRDSIEHLQFGRRFQAITRFGFGGGRAI